MAIEPMTERGLKMLANFEGTVLAVYFDGAGVATVGTGHALTKAEIASGEFAGGISRERAAELLRQDVGSAERAVGLLVKVPLAEGQRDALISFAFNVGNGALASSTLLQRLNAGDYGAVPFEMVKWDRRVDPRTGQKVEDPGLLKRRQAEANVWANGYDHPETRQAVADAVALQFDVGALVDGRGEEVVG